MKFVDSHSHIYDERLENRTNEIVANFENDNILCTLVPSCEYDSMIKAFELSQKYSNVFSALGIHPHDAKNFNQKVIDFYQKNSTNSKVVAIGEIGLDYYYDLSPRESQKDVLEWQLNFANSVPLPVIFHVRDAYQDFFEICKGDLVPSQSGVLHCFGGNLEDAKRGLDMGFYIGFTNNITYNHSENLREVVDYVPLDRMLIETDSPYMSPKFCRKEPNEPKNVFYVAEQIARQKGIALDCVADATTQNFFTLFKKAKL